jgi:hypothetical protein
MLIFSERHVSKSPNDDITTKNAAQKVQASIRLGEKAEGSAHIKISMEAQLYTQQHVNKQQCDAVQKVVMELRTQLGALRLLKDHETDAERKSTFATSELTLRLQECETQLVDTRVQRENAMKDVDFLKNLIGVERTGNQQAILIICELKREKETMKRRIEGLECKIRARKTRSRFVDAVNKVRIYLGFKTQQLYL